MMNEWEREWSEGLVELQSRGMACKLGEEMWDEGSKAGGEKSVNSEMRVSV
jgi:hypothetical protein